MKLKHYLYLTTLVCFLFVYSDAFGFPQDPPSGYKTETINYKRYTVSVGETVYSIASANGVTVEEVYALNPDARQGIKPNQILRVPVKNQTPVQTQNPDSYIFHSIQPKETLYSVSKLYNVSIENILAANPGLNSDNFRIGLAVKIPKGVSAAATLTPSIPVVPEGYSTHIVQSKETLYSISRKYNLSMDEIANANPEIKTNGLKMNMTLLIPSANLSSSSVETPRQTVSEINPYNSNTLRIAVLLPFLDQPEYQQARFVEYYEGFLLALEEFKAKGNSAVVYAFDISKGKDTKKLVSLLGTEEMKSLDLIIGGVSNDEISIISRFCQDNNISYVIPFPVKEDDIVKGNNVFQANTPSPYLYPKVSEKFCSLFSGYNVIIATDNAAKNDKQDFTAVLKKELDARSISNTTIDVNTDFRNNLRTSVSETRKNIIVPASASLMTLSKIFPALRNLKGANPAVTVNLFGYPDWQTYYSQFLAEYFKYETYIFTPFYFNSGDPKTIQFGETFRSWYGKTLLNTYPKYALLGYDTGLYFMMGLAKNKQAFAQNINNANVATLQSAFHFSPLQSGRGYANDGLYFIHYNTDSSIEIIDYSR
ncbi:MAG: LysM peptidoglycan-binding domain-containing protein [Dysgonomonas sp.]